MIIERKSIKLVRLTEQHIELVRQKRNLPEIQSTMEYREYITPEMQKKWFTSINNSNNLYFLIEVNNRFIGLVSGTGINWENGIVNNGGIFIWDKKYWQSPEAVQASVLSTDFGYYIGIKKNIVRILRDNNPAILFNKSLGYKLLPDQEHIYNQKYELTEDLYFNATKKIRQYFLLNTKIKISLTSSEYHDDDLAKKIAGSNAGNPNLDVEVIII